MCAVWSFGSGTPHRYEKLPHHCAFALPSNQVSRSTVSNLISWCIEQDITEISCYDSLGTAKRFMNSIAATLAQTQLQKGKESVHCVIHCVGIPSLEISGGEVKTVTAGESPVVAKSFQTSLRADTKCLNQQHSHRKKTFRIHLLSVEDNYPLMARACLGRRSSSRNQEVGEGTRAASGGSNCKNLINFKKFADSLDASGIGEPFRETIQQMYKVPISEPQLLVIIGQTLYIQQVLGFSFAYCSFMFM